MTSTELPPGVSLDDPDGVLLRDIQGNILRGYDMGYVRHLVVRVVDAGAARAFIADTVLGSDYVPQITSAVTWEEGAKPPTTLNVGVTATGLRALGLSERDLATFPHEFVVGAPSRAGKVGDVDESAPERWRDGLGAPDRVHLMWTIYAHDDPDERDAVTERLVALWRRTGAFAVTARLDGATFDTHTGRADDRYTVHYGYRDSIAQPRFQVNGSPIGRNDAQPIAPIGAVLLGRVGDPPPGRPDDRYLTPFPGIEWQMPEVTVGAQTVEIGLNGCFNAFRMLEQDVAAFEAFLEHSAAAINDELARRRDQGRAVDQPVWDVERVAAKLLGRWRNGIPLSHSHWTVHGAGAPFEGPGLPDAMDPELLNDFDYPDDEPDFDDFDGTGCPIGSHIRRANPRSSQIVQRSANFTRPIVRRGMPYGKPFDPDHPDDGEPRGLMGSFLCASLAAQFEAVMYDWINLGLGDPRVTGSNDPIIGANKRESSWFAIPIEGDEPIVLRGFPRFTTTVGGIYLFCPSIPALRFLSDPTVVPPELISR